MASRDSSSQSPLLKLAVETRCQIYDYVVQSNPSNISEKKFNAALNQQWGFTSIHPEAWHHGLRLVNHQIHDEFDHYLSMILAAKGLEYEFDITAAPPATEDGEDESLLSMTWSRLPAVRTRVQKITINANLGLHKHHDTEETILHQLEQHVAELLHHLRTTLQTRLGLQGHTLEVDELLIRLRRPLPSEREVMPLYKSSLQDPEHPELSTLGRQIPYARLITELQEDFFAFPLASYTEPTNLPRNFPRVGELKLELRDEVWAEHGFLAEPDETGFRLPVGFEE
ncbi:hypothetical protein CC80DRAFT_497390 [Byssothecium circinans]|uniref:Uncharacterized protein n=1 Tax=Byssothecium circinans TaxID=147558 RepID=A0A6A5TAL8_9PLEO|nr:hypothetical protein CC80DRAFT_497390 [Byssothecium circinans]